MLFFVETVKCVVRDCSGMGLSQNQLAKQSNVCASAFGMYAQGRREPSAKILANLSHVFDVSLDYLITGADTKTHKTGKQSGLIIIIQDGILVPSATRVLEEMELSAMMDSMVDIP